MENWRALIRELGTRTRYLLITLFIPEDPIGFVKSAADLEAQVSAHFEISELVMMKGSRFVILFAKSR